MKLKHDTYYHGTEKPIERFVDDFVGNGSDQEGPGIYFTSDFDDANSYGPYVYEVSLTPRDVLHKDDTNIRRISPLLVKRICKMSPDCKSALENWDYRPSMAWKAVTESILSYNENTFDVFQQMWIEFFRSSPTEFVRAVVKNTKFDAGAKDLPNGVEHVIVYNPNIIHFKKMHNMKGETNEIRKMVRSIVSEVAGQPLVAPGRTLDTEGLEEFLRQEGLSGCEEDIVSIVEGDPNVNVMNDVLEYVTFHKIGSDVSQLNAETILDYYIQWNHLNIDKNQVLAFSISEV